ncbi:oligoendopeptidase F [[Clostridium] fimetarium]|uniref:Oligopeptidase F n=1 Tax=[Clostridium] fimetarium TaxID=99656 RepID=A0A1I0RST3_9FIRM|nr:oligoendopeptidase F [[Clostridium] fimetarium]SEW44233.1 oligoendopeptidase F [[Clostridium] fimetarium]
MENVIIKRKDVDINLTWDLTSIFKTNDEFVVALENMNRLTSEIEMEYRGKINTAKSINSCLDLYGKVTELICLTSNYVELAVSVDYSNNDNQARYVETRNKISDVLSRLSFIKSELMESLDEEIDKAIYSSKKNAVYLEDIKKEKAYALHPEVERVLSALSNTLDAPYHIYEQTKLADMDFPLFVVDGKTYPLGYAMFENEYEYEINTKVRREAFNVFSNKLKEYQYTTAAAYQTQVQKEKTIANLRGFNSVFDSLLFSQKVDRNLYNRQIDLIMEKLAPHMRKYAKLLKSIHKLDKMTFADLKIAVDPEYDPTVTIEGSKAYMEGALNVLGDDYLDMVKSAYNDRWIDFAQNKGKSTGGFCSSPYGKNSFILLSWSEKMAEVFTLAHELGHAGHFRLCNEAQNIFDTEVSTYFVEAPSTLNELLMANYLLSTSQDKRFRRWVLSSMIGHTYYHNFVTHLLEAAYQREVYKILDEGGSVQADTLSKINKDVLEKFWGDAVDIVDGAELTWMRQPHYYMGLYSYTYSAGLTIATQVSKRILNEGQPAILDWLEVLKAGSTKTPVELAKMAGVDITTDQPLLDTIEYIGSVIDEIIDLTNGMAVKE